MSSERWIGQEVFIYRHPVDMRNYALRIVMRCSVWFGLYIKYPLMTFTAHNITAHFGFNIAMTLSVTLKHPFDTDGGNMVSNALSFSEGVLK